jgi:protein TonB
MASRIPDLEKDLVALAEEANKMRYAWNAVVARDPWLGGFDKSVMHIPEGRGEVPALGPCSDLSGEERQACTQGAILATVTAELSYPEEALAEEVTGTAYVRFEVDLEGWVRRAKVLVGVDPRLDREALRAVQSLPRFVPAHLDGEPVKMLYTVPVRFAIEQ